MRDAATSRRLADAMDAGRGVLRLLPTWVPRTFGSPGGRLRLRSADLYGFGPHRGGITERWLASTTKADNGPDSTLDEGLSSVLGPGSRFLLAEAVEADAAALIGEEMASSYGRWPVVAKFFDNELALPHHLHPRRVHSALVGREPKPEAYYFSPQMNPNPGPRPVTFFGLDAGVTKEDVRHCLERWQDGDNGILTLSRGYQIESGTGWFVPAGVLHAPGSLCTFEVQWGSDVLAVYQSEVGGQEIDRSLLVKDVPTELHDDLEFIVNLIDWEANTDPLFRRHHMLLPLPVIDGNHEEAVDRWVVYGANDGLETFSARELTVGPGCGTTLHDPGPSGVIVVQGSGQIAGLRAEEVSTVGLADATSDEFFFTAAAMSDGVEIKNDGINDLVLLRYFGPGVEAPRRDDGSGPHADLGPDPGLMSLPQSATRHRIG
jgi:hypothetical protein